VLAREHRRSEAAKARPRLARLQPQLAAEQIELAYATDRIARTAGGGAAFFASMKR
jgi:hypothetical protein